MCSGGRLTAAYSIDALSESDRKLTQNACPSTKPVFAPAVQLLPAHMPVCAGTGGLLIWHYGDFASLLEGLLTECRHIACPGMPFCNYNRS